MDQIYVYLSADFRSHCAIWSADCDGIFIVLGWLSGCIYASFLLDVGNLSLWFRECKYRNTLHLVHGYLGNPSGAWTVRNEEPCRITHFIYIFYSDIFYHFYAF